MQDERVAHLLPLSGFYPAPNGVAVIPRARELCAARNRVLSFGDVGKAVGTLAR